jgi:hypothetical protein
MVAAIGNGAAFAKGRDFGTWLGLLPQQIQPTAHENSPAIPAP